MGTKSCRAAHKGVGILGAIPEFCLPEWGKSSFATYLFQSVLSIFMHMFFQVNFVGQSNKAPYSSFKFSVRLKIFIIEYYETSNQTKQTKTP